MAIILCLFSESRNHHGRKYHISGNLPLGHILENFSGYLVNSKPLTETYQFKIGLLRFQKYVSVISALFIFIKVL